MNCIGRVRTIECTGQQVTKSTRTPQVVVQRVDLPKKSQEPPPDTENDFADEQDEQEGKDDSLQLAYTIRKKCSKK